MGLPASPPEGRSSRGRQTPFGPEEIAANLPPIRVECRRLAKDSTFKQRVTRPRASRPPRGAPAAPLGLRRGRVLPGSWARAGGHAATEQTGTQKDQGPGLRHGRRVRRREGKRPRRARDVLAREIAHAGGILEARLVEETDSGDGERSLAAGVSVHVSNRREVEGQAADVRQRQPRTAPGRPTPAIPLLAPEQWCYRAVTQT